MTFHYTNGTTQTVVSTETASTDFFNLKNRAAGARRYGYRASIVRYTNPEGEVAFCSEYQTLLDGERYQSSKYGAFVETIAEARTMLDKTILGAMKRYAKLAQNPTSKIERKA
jgi:hypothetical protein